MTTPHAASAYNQTQSRAKAQYSHGKLMSHLLALFRFHPPLLPLVPLAKAWPE